MKQKIMSALVIAIAALSLAPGGTGIAMPDGTPTYRETVFIMLEGHLNEKKELPDIWLRCDQNRSPVLRESKKPVGGGAYFTLGPTTEWQGGDAVCTAELRSPFKEGYRVLDTFSFVAVDAKA